MTVVARYQIPIIYGVAATPTHPSEDTADAVTAIVTLSPVNCQTAMSTGGTSTYSGFIR